MAANVYSVGRYYNTETGRHQWAVWVFPAQVWYFAPRYGRKAADALAARLNKGDRTNGR